jgi:hypothetical protein
VAAARGALPKLPIIQFAGASADGLTLLIAAATWTQAASSYSTARRRWSSHQPGPT